MASLSVLKRVFRTFAVRSLWCALFAGSLAVASSARAQAPTGTLVRLNFDGFGSVYLDLFDGLTPITVDNFLNYINSNRYDNTIIHRVDKSLGVIQGGGFDANWTDIPTDPLIPLEYDRANTRGTISMARFYLPPAFPGAPLDTTTASSQWFLNMKDNTQNLGQHNNGGYAVFGWVVGPGMDVVDAIGQANTFNFQPKLGPTPFMQMPLVDYTQEQFNQQTVDQAKPHSVRLTSVEVIGEHAAYQNPFLRGDVNNDGLMRPRDLLDLIDEIHANGEYYLTENFAGTAYLDVNGDNRFSRADIARIISDLVLAEQNASPLLASPPLDTPLPSNLLNFSGSLVAVPEPSSWALGTVAALGFAALAARLRRGRRA